MKTDKEILLENIYWDQKALERLPVDSAAYEERLVFYLCRLAILELYEETSQ